MMKFVVWSKVVHLKIKEKIKRRFMKEVSSGSSSSETGMKKRKLPNNSSSSSGNSSTKRRIIKTIHNYSLLPDTGNLKQRNRVLANRLNILTAMLKNFRKTSARRTMKVNTLSQVIREVDRKFALSKEATLALEASFMYTYRRLLMHQTQKDSSGNCIAQDQTNVSILKSTSEFLTVSDVHEDRNTDKQDRQLVELESTLDLFLPSFLNEYSENVVAYISGFVVRKLESRLKCFTCIRALYLEEYDELDNRMNFLDLKNKEGLIYSSRDVRKICYKIEKKIS
ncbi:hypothetical protein JTB14_021354 [Gonioctena quinquepunctata]|nr:hypothetical protein JTB14_021354 [Gonioctena quinquepunctata]